MDLRRGAAYTECFTQLDEHLARVQRAISEVRKSDPAPTPEQQGVVYHLLMVSLELVVVFAGAALRDGFQDIAARVLEYGPRFIELREQAERDWFREGRPE
ncbi:MAG: hypothetical protein WC538_22755 [Thermoanaerobaculia bacterium]|jgi:hypothetical protein